MLGQVQIPNCVLCSFGANDKAHGTMEAFTWHKRRMAEICIYNQLWLWKTCECHIARPVTIGKTISSPGTCTFSKASKQLSVQPSAKSSVQT